MAARFRKIGVTTIGACAGLGIAAWALNPFDRQYVVSNHLDFYLTNRFFLFSFHFSCD